MLVGAGGAAAGALEALTAAGARVRIVARRRPRPQALVDHLPRAAPAWRAPSPGATAAWPRALAGARMLISAVPAAAWDDPARRRRV